MVFKTEEGEMKVIMFQSRFASKIIDGSKVHTIRGERKRGIKSGDILSLREWTGKPYRSKQRILNQVICVGVSIITIPSPMSCTINLKFWEPLARNDGFDSFSEMLKWFHETHGLPFTGTLIEWIPTPQ